MTDVPHAAPNAAPGWYPEPNNPGVVRYWNGNAWESWRQPTVPMVAQSPVRPHNGMAITAFVLGIISLLLFLPYALAPVLGIVPLFAVAFGIGGLQRWRRQGGRVFSHLGIWFGTPMLLFALLVLIQQINR